MSGLQADARSMIEHARVESQNHSFHYNEQLRVESCTQAICDLALRFGEGADGEESIMSRPFGVALLIAGIDEDGPQLYVLTPAFLKSLLSLTFFSNIIIMETNLLDKQDSTPNPPGHSTAMTRKQSAQEAKEHKPNCKMNFINP